jgi:CheY-like chemotaxis protein
MDAGPPLAVQRVVLLGFGDFERHALDSYLRLSGSRRPSFEQVESLQDADFVIADADHVDVLATVQQAGRTQDTVFIGSVAPDGALGWTMRPIDPIQVFRELEAAVAIRHSATLPAATPLAAAAEPDDPAPAAEVPDESASTPEAGNDRSTRRAGDATPPPVALLVDDSEIALRFLQRQLHALGMRTECAGSSEFALELLAQQRFDAVFLDLDLGPGSELDGLMLCQHLKQSARAAGEAAPRVLMVSAHHGATNRVRATFAGCDAFLGKPLDEEALKRALRQLGLLPGGDPGHRLRRRHRAPTSGPIPLSSS